jgi:hypothetical protein
MCASEDVLNNEAYRSAAQTCGRRPEDILADVRAVETQPRKPRFN